jgi:FkbM family methyltransferase
VPFSIDLRDRIQREMWCGCFEPHVTSCLVAILRPGDTFLDVGAHIGYHSVTAALLVGEGGRVFAFEADPANFSRLESHVRPFPWVTALHYAVWSHSTSLIFERSSQTGESGWGSLACVRVLGTGEQVTVNAISLDDWRLQTQIEKVSLVKIDAEGSEPNIVQGAREFLQRMKPSVIFEFNETVLLQGGRVPKELAQGFGECGYKLFSIDGRHLREVAHFGLPQFGEILGLHRENLQESKQRLRMGGFRI